ncbi:unnamed protein product [Brassica rapa]|uniref:t-SNARE coiled-coil homology domain-containing protein n=2 Tax=Brassica TaxID=3705 RepID=A0A3P6BPZ9_BRACM|nr:unnamed protein product [Brassica rapa]VDD03044.1 unnamed protein product [Brassica rapa]
MKDSNRQSKQLEELAGRMRNSKRCTLGNKKVDLFGYGSWIQQVNPQQKKMCLHVSLCLHEVAIGSLKLLAATSMSNQELVDAGMRRMDETDQAIEHPKQVVHQTVEIDTQTAANLKGQADQMGRVGNDLDTIQFSIKKASKLVKEIERQFLNAKATEAVATDTCIMMFLFLMVGGVIAIIVVKMVDREPSNKDIRDIQ